MTQTRIKNRMRLRKLHQFRGRRLQTSIDFHFITQTHTKVRTCAVLLYWFIILELNFGRLNHNNNMFEHRIGMRFRINHICYSIEFSSFHGQNKNRLNSSNLVISNRTSDFYFILSLFCWRILEKK